MCKHETVFRYFIEIRRHKLLKIMQAGSSFETKENEHFHSSLMLRKYCLRKMMT